MANGNEVLRVTGNDVASVRLATAEDSAAIWGLCREMGSFVNCSLKGSESEAWSVMEGRTEEDFRREAFGEGSPCRYVLAEFGTDVVGYGLYYPCYNTFQGLGVSLEELYIQERHRHKGIGKDLVRAVVKLGARDGATRLEFGCYEWNKEAIAFYHTLGAHNWTKCDGVNVFVIEDKAFQDLTTLK